ncbi:monooxygenase [Mangrovihabitans endophyticus]|uniref:Spheroidene monooxygenase n=1 Tax=Mangrovihabitans endophyticus TaxID=1751298 RepID=A0A8J3FKD0_9ACTN|nr:monooxygenase [Mangrovihabitans endophyticus]GGK70334.1 hypothetical protein GCM10012284_00240 [Mangrovihabitans endophyticus]
MHVDLYVWRVPRRAIPAVLWRMAVDPRRTRALPGVRFVKLLGTGTGTGFGPGDVDATRYAALVVRDHDAPEVTWPGWDRIAVARARLRLNPLASRGRWSGRAPFGVPRTRRTGRADGPVLALTRARLRPAKALTFWRSVPPVAAELHAAPGLLARFGIGEAPVGWQGTVSVWRGTADLTAFAYRQPEHRAVIARTPTDRWYAEDLFARFAVVGVEGDRAVLDWREDL